jgi:hypothetical protein
MSQQMNDEVELVEEWAARLCRMSQEAFLAANPNGNMQTLTAALSVASGRLLQAYCPEEMQPEGAEILVNFLRHGILTKKPEHITGSGLILAPTTGKRPTH